jgi:hypothetical protein
VDPKRLIAMVSAYNLSEEIATAIYKIHSEAAPAILRDRALSLDKPNKLAEAAATTDTAATTF